ncbi:MAG: hypothetical protein ACLPXB_14640, partial [Thiobacillaceae bacterium]
MVQIQVWQGQYRWGYRRRQRFHPATGRQQARQQITYWGGLLLRGSTVSGRKFGSHRTTIIKNKAVATPMPTTAFLKIV